jgi:hypothetical protein
VVAGDAAEDSQKEDEGGGAISVHEAGKAGKQCE